MIPAFITLPSGLRINTAHILEYREWSPGKTSITQNVRDPEGGRIVFEEDMTAAELDALLQPQGTPIVSPIWNVADLKPGKQCCFPYKGSVLHGIFGGFFTDETRDAAMLRFRSGEEVYHMWTDDYVITKLQ